MSSTAPTYPGTPFMRAFAAAVEANVPVLLWGDPGQAKTATIENAASSWGREHRTIIGSTREATDFLGIMVETDGIITYSTFEWVRFLNAAKKALLIMDEFNTANPSTMKGMVRTVQERYVGDEKLNDSVAIVAIANPPATGVDAYDLPAPMANRMLHLDWVFDTELWMDNVGTNFEHVVYPKLDSLLSANPVTRRAAVAAAVATYHKQNPDQLTPPVPTDPVKAGQAWASPRSWTNLISAMSHLEKDDLEAIKLVIDGTIGEATGLPFFTWYLANDLHDPAEVLDNPGIVDWANERPDRLFFLVNSVTNLGLSVETNWKKAALALAACANGDKPDVALPGAQKLMNNVPQGEKMPLQFRNAFTELFGHTHNRVTAAV